MTQLKHISFWAKKHTCAARIIIICAFIIMNFLGIVTGLLFSSLNVTFSSLILLLSVLIFVAACFKYPSQIEAGNIVEKNRFYILRKTSDFVLIGCTFIMFVYFGNRQISPLTYSVFTASAVNLFSQPKDSSKTYKSIDEFKKMMKDENGKTLKWKERKKLLKTQIKAIKKANDLSEGGKVALIILCVLLAVILAYGVAALSCSLSCSGSEGAAVVVAVLGLAGIILLTFFLIRAIIRKSKKDKAKEIKSYGRTRQINSCDNL